MAGEGYPEVLDLAGLGRVLRTCISLQGAADAAAAKGGPRTVLSSFYTL